MVARSRIEDDQRESDVVSDAVVFLGITGGATMDMRIPCLRTS